VNAYTNALVAAAAMLLLLPVTLTLFKTPFKFIDVVAAAIIAGATTLVPLVGGPVSFVATLVYLKWRLSANVYPDIFYPVGIARLATIPVLLLLQHR
jgi:hypothetical protein